MSEERKYKLNEFERPWDNLSDVETIVSIDFGSFGFAASFCPINAPDHQHIVPDWANSEVASELNKNLAALLIDKDSKETVAMGYKAEELYKRAQERKEDHKYMYFEHFKPYLYSRDYLEKNIPVPSADGQSTLPLADLITKSLYGVMEHSLSYINGLNTMAGINTIDTNNVYWVISVPAIWDEMSKEMMKSCAKNAGMIHFELGSEPIVSTFHVLNCQGDEFRLKPRDKIMILDCGGGTIDAACIEIKSSAFDLSELHHGDGIRAGGLDVDYKFLQLLHELLPQDIIKPIKTLQSAQWMRQKREFILAKFSCPLDLEDNDAWNVPFCYGINTVLSKKRRKRKRDDTYQTIKDTIDGYTIPDYMNDIQQNVKGSFKLGKCNLKIDKNGWLYLHSEVFDKIITFVRDLFSNGRVYGCDKVIVVGGFANSKYLIHRLVSEFPEKTFFKPRQPHLAVVRGALYWICQREHLRRTRAKYSYGIAIDRMFNPNIDPLSRRKHSPQGGIVENAFNALVVRHEEYEDGYTEQFDYWIPAGADNLEIYLYASEDEFCQYVFNEDGTLPTEDGKRCFVIKKFMIPIDNPSNERAQFQITLEYNQNGINLRYIDPNDGNQQCVAVDTTISASASHV